MQKVVLGSRGSKLALWQANYVANLLKGVNCKVDIKVIKTKGDEMTHLSFDKIEGKGFFTKEIEDSLLDDEIDFAVHSMKDLPTTQPAGLMIAALSERADPRDILLLHKDKVLSQGPLKLNDELIIGTSSMRRKANIKALFPKCNLKDIRGNVPTRLQKLRDGDFDGIILAKAGLDRLELNTDDLFAFPFEPTEFIPAPAQGVLAYQCKKESPEIISLLRQIHSRDSSDCTNVERKVLKLMDGGCHMPLGVFCKKDNLGYYHAHASFAKSLDTELVRVSLSQSTSSNLADNIYHKLTD